MNKEYRCKSQFDLAGKMRSAQSLILSGPQGVGVAAYALSGTAARASLLQNLTIDSTANGSVTQIKIAGQNLNTTDQPGHVAAFSGAANAVGVRQRFIGIAVKSQQASTIAIDGTLIAAGDINFGVSLHPLDDSQVPTIEEQASFFNYYAGLGSVAVPAAGNAQLRAVTTRACKLGWLILTNETAAVPNNDLTITSIEVNGLEYLGGNNDQAVSFDQFAPTAADVLGNMLHAEVEANAVILITCANKGGAPATITGTIFCE